MVLGVGGTMTDELPPGMSLADFGPRANPSSIDVPPGMSLEDFRTSPTIGPSQGRPQSARRSGVVSSGSSRQRSARRARTPGLEDDISEMSLGQEDDDRMDDGEDEEDVWDEMLRNDFAMEEVVTVNPLFGRRNPLSKRKKGALSEIEIVSGRTEVVVKNPLYNPNNNWSSKKLRYHDDAIHVFINPLAKSNNRKLPQRTTLEQEYKEAEVRGRELGSDVSSDGDDLVMQGLMTDIEEFSELDSDYELLMGSASPTSARRFERLGLGPAVNQSREYLSTPNLRDPMGLPPRRTSPAPSVSDDDHTSESLDSDIAGVEEMSAPRPPPEPFYYKRKRGRSSLLNRNRTSSFDSSSAPVARRNSFASVPANESPMYRTGGSPQLAKRRKSTLVSMLRRGKKKSSTSSGDNSLLRSVSSEASLARPTFAGSPDLSDRSTDSFDSEEDWSDASALSYCEVSIPRYMQNLPVVIECNRSVEPSLKEQRAFAYWLRIVMKDVRSPPDSLTLQMAVFLHFYRLDIPVEEIVGSKIASKQGWKKRGRKNATGTGYYNLPLFGTIKWWAISSCERALDFQPRQQFTLVCHERQTVPKKGNQESQKISKRDFLAELKAGNDWTLLVEHQLFFRNILINHCVRWATCTDKSIPKQYKLLACRQLASLAYPAERIPGIAHAVVASKALPPILQYARLGEIAVYEPVTKNDVKPGKLLARGAVGNVYEATWKDQKVVIKVCKENGPAFDMDEFRFEISLMTMLNSEFLLPCHAVCMQSPSPFYVAPYKAHGALSEHLNQEGEKLDSRLLISIAMHIASGMRLLHSVKVVHRDLKPANVLLDEQWNACVADFGTSRLMSADDTRPLESLVGTTPYMAPEMFVEGKTYTEKVDVYSFGIMLLEIVTGEDAWSGVKTWDIPDLVIDGKRPPLPKLSKQLGDLITSCWHHNPKKRPSFRNVLSKLRTVDAKNAFK